MRRVELTGDAPKRPSGYEPEEEDSVELVRRIILDKMGFYIGRASTPDQIEVAQYCLDGIMHDLLRSRPDVKAELVVDDDDPRMLRLKVYSEEEK